jgi:hypothetical protein
VKYRTRKPTFYIICSTLLSRLAAISIALRMSIPREDATKCSGLHKTTNFWREVLGALILTNTGHFAPFANGTHTILVPAFEPDFQR